MGSTITLAAALGLLAAIVGAWIVDRRRLNRQLRELRQAATIDPVSGMRNRRAFEEDLQRELLRGERTGRPAAIAVIDVEDPDVAPPQQLAVLIAGVTRAVDTAYRIGACEYVLLLPETRAVPARTAIERVSEAFRSLGVRDFFAGIAEAGPGIDRHELFRHAYRACMCAREEPRPRVLVYSEDLPVPSGSPSVQRKAHR